MLSAGINMRKVKDIIRSSSQRRPMVDKRVIIDNMQLSFNDPKEARDRD